jgi:outer membrane lipoprotein SlyB
MDRTEDSQRKELEVRRENGNLLATIEKQREAHASVAALLQVRHKQFGAF